MLDTKPLEDDSLGQLEVISKQLEEKCTLLKTLDESILAACPTKEIESEIVEAEELTNKITQLRAEIGSVLPSVRMGERAAGSETLSHELIETREPTGHVIKTGAPDTRDSKEITVESYS